MTEGSLSPGVLRMVGVVGPTVSFREGHELLHELAGIEVSTKHVERAAETLGRKVADDERRIFDSPEPEISIAPTLYLGMDGTGVPMRRSEVDGRPGKQPDGSSKTREVKLCTVWSAEDRDPEGIPMRDKGSVSYSAAIESAATSDTDDIPSEFAQRVVREATRRGFDRASRRVLIGDGARWIWNIADEFFPDAIQIVDLYHAKEHLYAVAKAIYGAGNDLSEEWAEKRCKELDDGEFDSLLTKLRIHSKTQPDAAKCLNYFLRNRNRMNYPIFRAAGLSVGSGVVEAGCKRAIGARLKSQGMHWSFSGANAIIALRCCRLSGRFDVFWKRQTVSCNLAV